MIFRICVFVVFSCFASSGTYAQETLPDNFHYSRTHYGLEMLVIEDNTVPLVTVELALKNGAFTEPPEFDGLSHLYEHMFFKANKEYPSHEAYQARVRELGINYNGTTSTERVNYYLTLSNRKLKEALNFMSVAIQHPLFLEEEMKRENLVVDGEFERNESNPFFHLRRDVAKVMWGKHFSHKNTIGDHNVIKNATPEMMETIKERYYHPNNCLLIIAGDVDSRSTLVMAEKIFEDWTHSGASPFVRHPVPEIVPIYHSSQVVTETDLAKAPSYMIQLHGPDFRHDVTGTIAADVFSYILQQENSRLKQALVETGLALDVSLGYYTQRYIGPIDIRLTPAPGMLATAYDTLMNEISNWNDSDYFTDEQMQNAKEMLTIQAAFQQEKTSEFAHTVSFFWASTSLDYFGDYTKNVQAITREDITEYIERYIIDKPYVAGLLISPEMRASMETDSFFTPTLSPIESYTFNFKQNSLQFSDSLASEMFLSLLQWMEINPTVRIQINGYADGKREMTNINNQEIKTFTKELEDFKMFPKLYMGTQDKSRLDFFRALKIVKMLADNGIAIDRMQGSGRLLKSEKKEDMFNNLKVVVSMAQ